MLKDHNMSIVVFYSPGDLRISRNMGTISIQINEKVEIQIFEDEFFIEFESTNISSEHNHKCLYNTDK